MDDGVAVAEGRADSGVAAVVSATSALMVGTEFAGGPVGGVGAADAFV